MTSDTTIGNSEYLLSTYNGPNIRPSQERQTDNVLNHMELVALEKAAAGSTYMIDLLHKRM